MIAHQRWRAALRQRVRVGGLVTRSAQVNRCRLLQEVIGVENFAAVLPGLLEQRGAVIEGNRARRADHGAGWPQVALPALGAKVALDRVMLLGVVTDGAVGAGQGAFATAGAAVLVHRHHAGNRVLGNCLGINRAGAQAGGALALLAGDGQEI